MFVVGLAIAGFGWWSSTQPDDGRGANIGAGLMVLFGGWVAVCGLGLLMWPLWRLIRERRDARRRAAPSG
jgi:hypothetical protein